MSWLILFSPGSAAQQMSGLESHNLNSSHDFWTWTKYKKTFSSTWTFLLVTCEPVDLKTFGILPKTCMNHLIERS